ncbi:MAG: hypothetical protein WAT74_16485 [Flavobacteriales bacterium]
MRQHSIATVVLVAVALMSACKKEDDDAATSGNNAAGGVELWTARLLVIQGTDTAVLAPPQWQATTESEFTPSGVPDYWLAKHDIVMTNTSNPTEQWRFGFIGNFLTTTGTGPTATQTASMISLGTIIGGRWNWNAVSMSYEITEGARVSYTNPSGTEYNSSPTSSMQVQQVQLTGQSSGVRRQAQFRSSGNLSGLGSRTCIYRGPVHIE